MRSQRGRRAEGRVALARNGKRLLPRAVLRLERERVRIGETHAHDVKVEVGGLVNRGGPQDHRRQGALDPAVKGGSSQNSVKTGLQLGKTPFAPLELGDSTSSLQRRS